MQYPSYTTQPPPAEPYGQVHFDPTSPSSNAASGMTQRRHGGHDTNQPSTYTAASPPSYTTIPTTAPSGFASGGLSPSYAAAAAASAGSYGYATAAAPASILVADMPSRSAGKKAATGGAATTTLTYPHNVMVSLFWIPSLLILLSHYESSTPMVSFLCISLGLYAMDLANLRQPLVFGTWLSVLAMTLICGWFILVEDANEENGDGGAGAVVLLYLIQIAVNALLFVCGACWITLQVEWLSNTTHMSMEQTLFALLPLVSSAIVTIRLALWLEGHIGRDGAALLGPFIFGFLLTVAMMTLGCAAPPPRNVEVAPHMNKNSNNMEKSSSSGRAENDNDKDGIGASSSATTSAAAAATSFIISPPIAFGHTTVLLLGPAAMHLATCLGRILSSYASTDDLYDFVLASTIPYMMQYLITLMHETGWRPSPYPTPKLGNSTTLAGVLRPMIVGLIASLALQQRYVISLSNSMSSLFNADGGTKMPAWLASVYMTGTTLCLIFTMSIWGRVSSVTNEPLFGEYHEDVLQLGLSLTGLLAGKAVGLPWNFTPLPVLAFLGLSLWLTTRMLRYLVIFLFVMHASGVVVFTYRFAGIENTVTVPPFGVTLSLLRFALVTVGCSILVGLVAGLSVRSSGGYGGAWLRKLDITGVVFILYLIALMALEITLYKRPVPVSELVGVISATDEAENDQELYDPAWAFVTSAVALAISVFMHQVKIISGKTFAVIVSLAVGKAMAIYIDSASLPSSSSSALTTMPETVPGAKVFWQAMVTAVLGIMMCYPRFLLKPVYVKSAAKYRRSICNSRGNTQLPEGAGRVAIIYVFIILPVSLVVSVPYVLIPLSHALKADFQGSSFYDTNPPASEVMGFALTLWGASSLSMLNYYLPDGGGEVWKKLAALGFLSGVGVFFAAPTLGFSGDAMSNPYVTISSVGIRTLNQGKSRTGGWGLVSSGLATLLALTGPLELKERKTDSVRRDKFLLFRTMVFSMMFGGGVTWFIIMQSMSEAPWLVLLLTGLSCLAISFLGTICAVLSYFIDLEDMEEVEQVFKIWLVAMPIFLPVTGLPQFLSMESSHPFGVGGWLSTYLVICSVAMFAFALAMRARLTKNPMTRGLGNLGAVLSWIFAICVLYGRYGVAGLDVNYDVTTIFGIPASIFGTFALSVILLALEGESVGERSRTKRVTSSMQKSGKSSSSFGIVLEELTAVNLWVPVVAGISVVLVVASLYAVVLRGASFLLFLGGGSAAARSHEQVFSAVFGDDKDEHDLETLAKKAILHVKALATSAQLAGAGFWTAQGLQGPLLHLIGIAAVVPSLYLLVSQGWWMNKKLSPMVVLCLPLNFIPLVVARGIPSLQAAAILGLAGGTLLALADRKATHSSNMRI